MNVLKEGDVVYLKSEAEKMVITDPDKFIESGLEFELLYNKHDRKNGLKLN